MGAKKRFHTFVNFKKSKPTPELFQTTTQEQAMVCRGENVDEKESPVHGYSKECRVLDDKAKIKTKKASNFPRKNLAIFEKSCKTKSRQVKHANRPVGGDTSDCEKRPVEEEFATVSYEEMCRTIDQKLENHERQRCNS